MMLADPSKKYRRMYQRVDLPDRQWPNNEITKAPIWMSTDLRDGNQAIFEPMDMEQKFKMFQMLVKIGFKNILKRLHAMTKLFLSRDARRDDTYKSNLIYHVNRLKERKSLSSLS